jgi:hypothetical protein
MSAQLQPPKLTLPPAEAEAVCEAYAAARVILEYGSGGSTVVAAQVPGARVFSVESDADWVKMMAEWFAANPAKANLTLHYADIGPTKAWGMPVNNRSVGKWPGYPNSVWDLADFEQPDTVLIDGRFRLACFMTVLLRAVRPVTVYWDDYIDRKPYHEAESFVKPVRFHGRMAEFHLEPMTFPMTRLGWLTEVYLRTQ